MGWKKKHHLVLCGSETHFWNMFSGTGWPSCQRTSYGCKSRTHWHVKSSCFQSRPNDQTCLERWRYLKWWTRRRLKSARLKSWFFLGQLFDDIMMIWLHCFLYCLHKLYCTWVISRAVHELLLPGTGKTYLMVWQASWKRSDLDAKRYSSNPNPRRSMYGILWYSWPRWMFGFYDKW